MHSKHGIKAEIIKNTLMALMGAITAHADDGKGDPGAPNPINYEDLIAKARKEEKDKLYGKIQTLESQNSSLVQSCNNHLIEIGKLKDENAKLKENSSQSNSEEVNTLNNKIATLEAKVATLEGEKEVLQKELKAYQDNPPVDEESLRNTIREELKAEYEVKDYRRDKIAELGDKILKSFADTVTGTTKEEVDESIKLAVEKSTNVRKELGLVDDEGNPIKGKTPSKKSPTKPPKTPNPADNTSGATYDTEYIRSLDPTSEEYMEFRKQMGLK